ncbi:MAG: hypothetical protein EB127_14945 [Alphaproteobacteria bacterium]|nr:hypothetical protein [Alphaproteobacteria bacterium]
MSVSLTYQQCQEWLKNPTVNPKTKKVITVGKDTYNKIKEHCLKKHNLEINESSVGVSPPQSRTQVTQATQATKATSSRPPLPKKVNGVDMPQTKDAWRKTAMDLKNVLYMYEFTELRFVTESDLELFPTYSTMCELALAYDLINEKEKERENTMKEKFQRYHETPLEIVRIIPKKYENDYAEYKNRILQNFPRKKREKELYFYQKYLDDGVYKYINRDIRYIFNKPYEGEREERDYKEKLKEDLLGYTRRLCIAVYNLLIDEEDIINRMKILKQDYLYKPITKSLEVFEKVIGEFDNIRGKRETSSKDKIASTSRSASLPASISREKMKKRVALPKKPVQMVIDGETVWKIDRTAPDEFREYSQTVEPPTARSEFRRHSALSKMSPLSFESLEPLPVKTRVQILKELRGICSYMKDGISNKRFDRMSKKNLQLIVKIGDVDGQKRCYYVRNIYKYWEQMAKSKKKLTDPETRKIITEVEKADIMKKIRYLNKNAPKLESKEEVAKDPNLHLVIGTVESEHGGLYYQLRVERKLTEFGSTDIAFLVNLGYIPADIESVNGDINISSDTVISMIKELFDKGRIVAALCILTNLCHIGKEQSTKEVVNWH